MRRLLVSAVAAAIVLAACGSDNDDGGSAEPAASAVSVSGSEPAADTVSGSGDAPSGEKAEITVLGTLKPEIATQFEAAIEEYNSSQDLYEVVVIPLDTNPLEKMTALYASGNAPTIIGMSQEFSQFQDRLLDLTDAPFTEHALPGTTNGVTVGGRVYGMPLTVEAFGLLYNQAVLDEAVGGTFDPATIRTRSAMVELFNQIVATGRKAMHVSPMDWSLGAHQTNVFFTDQSADRAERLAFIDGLKAGDVSLMDNQVFTGWAETFDRFKEYNENAASPLVPEYDQGALALGGGEVGTWFMGNWALPNLLEVDPAGEFGILPVPISDNPDDYGNSQMSVGVPFYLVIDASQSSKAEQAGAIDFLNWLVSDPAGQRYYVDEFKFLPVFDNIELQPADPLSQQILKYVADGESLEWMNSLYPPEGQTSMGVSMQKYLAGATDLEGLAKEIEQFWTTVGS